MIPMEYLSADIRGYDQINPAHKSSSSMNRNRYMSGKYKTKNKSKAGPAVILCLGEHEDDYTLGYDQFGKPKKI